MKKESFVSVLSQLPTPPEGRSGFPWTEETPCTAYDKRMTYPKITIVTPSFNQGQFLEETIRSVLLQNYPNIEYIIIDGGSTDESVEIIKRYEKWINYWVSEPDSGQANAINKGLKKASGEIFNWLNSDDWYARGALKQVAEAFENDAISAVSFREYTFEEGQIKGVHKGSSIFKTVEETLAHFHIDQPCTFFRLDKLKQIGALNEDLHYLFDAEMWIRYLLLCGNSIAKRSEVVNYFRLHNTSKTVTQQPLFHKEALLLICVLLRFSNIDELLKQEVLRQGRFDGNVMLKIYNTWDSVKSVEINVSKFDAALKDRISLHFFWQHNYHLCKLFPVKTMKTKAYRSAFLYHYLTIFLTEKNLLRLLEVKRAIYRKIKPQE